MDEREEKVVAGVTVLGGLGLAFYLLSRKAKAKPKPEWIEVTDFEVVSAEK